MSSSAMDECAICAGKPHTNAHFTQADESSVPNLTMTTRRWTNDGVTMFPETTITYQRTSQLKIFLSYGHDRFQLLAFHLKHLLQERGHLVWFDTEKLSAGIDWENGIAGALTWVKEAQHDGRVLLLMTPHALRRPDGYCLNEIARAASMWLNIFPVMVAESDPPPSTAMLPYFDMRDCVPNSMEAMALDGKGSEWNAMMKSLVHSDTFHAKVTRLFSVLELFDSMSAYGVPSVAGVENLGVFPPSHDASAGTLYRESRAHSLCRLYTKGGSDSIGSQGARDISPSPRRSHRLPSSEVGTEGNESSKNVLEGVQEDTEIDTTELIENCEEALSNVRYMFSFDPSCYILAKRLYEDLTVSGFAVFPPSSPLTDIIDSNNSNVIDALQWAAAQKNGKMILLVTPESVGRPSGISLNDISAAMAAGMGFVPLMVRQCEIPLSICRIQWLDMSDCLIYDSESSGGHSSLVSEVNEVRYAIRRDQLETALRGKLDHEGHQARLFSLLAPFSFQSQISKLTTRFTGRTWLFDTLRNWIDTPNGSPVFWITGQIGSGKTSVAAKLVQTVPEIAAFHFALQEDEQTQIARRCLLSLAYQLTTQLPEYTLFLQQGEPLQEIVAVSSVQSLLTQLLIKPLQAIARPQSNKPLLLLIDGLEHLITSSGELARSSPPTQPNFQNDLSNDGCLVSLLPSLISRLPTWVRIVLLSREDHSIVLKLQDYTPNISLDRHQEDNEKDICLYIQKSLSAKDSHTSLLPQGSNLESSQFTITPAQMNMIAKRSEGLFLYAINIVQSLQEGRLDVNQLESLPLGMGGYLRQFFESHFDLQTYTTTIRAVLEVVCAAYEPLTMSTLASIFNWSAYEQHSMTTRFSALLYVADDGCLRPFHSSVLDWIQDIKTAGKFYADLVNGHERLALWAVQEYDRVVLYGTNEFVNLKFNLEQSEAKTSSDAKNNRMHIYIVRHLYNHLMQARDEKCIELVGRFASDEKFQLARRLLTYRSQGLETFFHGDISRPESEMLLSTRPYSGSFLIRYSTTKKSYCVSFIDSINPLKFKHNLIYHLSDGAYSIVSPESKDTVIDSKLKYPDLVSFVEQYQRKGVLREAIPRVNPLNREISSS